MDVTGRGPAKKSVDQLQTKLSEYDKLRRTDVFADRLGEVTTLIRGWYNYYQTLKPIKPGNILTLMGLVGLAGEFGQAQLARQLLKEGTSFKHNHPEVAFQLGELLAGSGLRNQAMREYARALEMDPNLEKAKERIRSLQEGETTIHEAIEKINLVLHHNPHYREGYQKLAEYYTELGLYGFAEKAHQKALELDDDPEAATPPPHAEQAAAAEAPGPEAESAGQAPAPFDYHEVDLDLFLDLFQGRADAHSKQWVDERGRWGFVRVERGLKAKDVYKHVKGDETLAVYPVTELDTVRFIVFDVDTAKRTILESEETSLEDFRNKAHHDILRIKAVCDRMELSLYIEDSGYKGRHGWMFFESELPALAAIHLGREIMRMAGGPSDGMIWELFPMGKTERHLSQIKLPLGINLKNNRRCLFMNENNEAVPRQDLLLKTVRRNKPEHLQSILQQMSVSSPDGAGARIGAEGPGAASGGETAMSPGLAKMVNGCKVIHHLMAKARDTNYLNHYERLYLLYTLTFAGEEGRALLHKTIGYCINYDPQFTQRHIERRKESPMSCPRIMETFPELAATLPCNCKFRLPPRSYPSPVLYLMEAEMEAAGAEPPPTDKAEGGRKPMNDPEQAEDRKEARDETSQSAQELVLDFERISSSEFEEEAEGVSPREPSGGSPDSGASSDMTRKQLPAPDPPFPLEDGRNETVDEGASSQNGRAETVGGKAWEGADPVEVARKAETDGAAEAVDEPESTGGGRKALHDPRGVDLRGEDWDGKEGQDAPDIWELLAEYLRLKVAREKASRDLLSTTMRLDLMFDRLGKEAVETPLGVIRRQRGPHGGNEWVLTVRD